MINSEMHYLLGCKRGPEKPGLSWAGLKPGLGLFRMSRLQHTQTAQQALLIDWLMR